MPAHPKLCIVTTSPIVVRFFLMPHLRQLAGAFDVTLVANDDCSDVLGDLASHVRMVVVPVQREIAPWQDQVALVQLIALFRRERFDGVVTIAPKAGLLGNMAAFVARVPYRCHIFQGEVWASRTGPIRALLRLADMITSRTTTEVLVVSATEREFLISEGILTAARSTVLDRGSICGVDTTRFAPSPELRRNLRNAIGIPQDAPLVLFLGRLHRDKGVLDLVTAWTRLAGLNPDLHLAIVGPDEDNLVPRIRNLAGTAFANRLHLQGLTSRPEEWMAAADILCLPSYREGFGNVLIEAGACGIPVIASRIYGIADAMTENVTGLMHTPGDRHALARELDQLVKDPALRAKLGAAGRAMVINHFEQSRVIQNYTSHFVEMCRKAGFAKPGPAASPPITRTPSPGAMPGGPAP
jgi:glycosyltransferase involved in cell wall biosynthesis